MKVQLAATRLLSLVLIHAGFAATTSPLEEIQNTFHALDDLSSAVSESCMSWYSCMRFITCIVYCTLCSTIWSTPSNSKQCAMFSDKWEAISATRRTVWMELEMSRAPMCQTCRLVRGRFNWEIQHIKMAPFFLYRASTPTILVSKWWTCCALLRKSEYSSYRTTLTRCGTFTLDQLLTPSSRATLANG